MITEAITFTAKSSCMTSFENYYIQCPCCTSWLMGKSAKTESVSQSILYSDGMIVSDLLPINPQKIVLCPACAYFFWHDSQPVIQDEAQLNGFQPYPWSSWHLFGCNLLYNAGRKALINHYWHVLKSQRPLDQAKEISIRKSLLWAYNDLYRECQSISFKDFYKGKLSLRSWINLRRFNKESQRYFEAEKENFLNNLKPLIRLTEKEPDVDPAVLAELYREAGDFDKATKALSGIIRRTHFISSLQKYIQARNRHVFKVAG
jgi:hypothetical protein